MAKGNQLAEVREILEAAQAEPPRLATGGYSPLFMWMWKRFDTLAPVLNEGAQAPNWTKMAETFAARGIMAGNGKPPTATTVRKTWWKVQQVKERGGLTRRRSRATTSPSAPEAVAAQPPAATKRPALPATVEPDEDDLAGFDFARPKQH